jgi:hypothetical protein
MVFAEVVKFGSTLTVPLSSPYITDDSHVVDVYVSLYPYVIWNDVASASIVDGYDGFP